MEGWTPHWLEAEGSLHAHRARILAELQAAYAALAESGPPPRLDLLLQRTPGRVIPDLGLEKVAAPNFELFTQVPAAEVVAAAIEGGLVRR